MGQLDDMFVILCEMWFEDYRSEIMLQKTLLNQRKRICYLNLNWWNNLNLILTSLNSWDALPNLGSTELFIISLRPYFSHTQSSAHCSKYRLHRVNFWKIRWSTHKAWPYSILACTCQVWIGLLWQQRNSQSFLLSVK